MKANRYFLILMLFFCLLLPACDSGSDDDDNDSSGVLDDDDADDDSADNDTSDDDNDDDDDDDTLDDDTDDDDIAYAPTEPGPYEVGNRTLILVDPSRWDPATNSKRKLVVEVWYPATDEAAALPRDNLLNFLNGWDAEVLELLADMGVPPEELANLDQEMGSARDAEIKAEDGPFPMVLFSHGNAGVRWQNFTMCEYLAGHGFVVVAPDHTGNALVAPFPDEFIIFDEDLIFIAYSQRYHDLSFLIDQFAELNEDDPSGFFTNTIDLTKVGAMGHSFGGTTVVEVTKRDKRIRATVDMASFMFPWFYGEFDASLMFMIGLEDNTMGDVTFLMRFAYRISPAPKFKMEFRDGGHYTFTDACLLMPSLMGEGDGCGTGERRWGGEPFEYIDHDAAFEVINAQTTAFFGYNLRSEAHMEEYLRTNQPPEGIYYEYEMP